MKKYTNTQQKSYAAGRRKKNSRKGVPMRAMKMKIKKGDKVKVLAGKDKGKTGVILTVLPRENRVVVEGVAMVKRHHRRSGRGQSGRIVEHPASIHASNVGKVEASEKKAPRAKKAAAAK